MLARSTGVALIALALAFNLAFLALGASFDYPQILREPAAEILSRFAAGGTPLILTWYVFALSAGAMTPVAVLLGRATNDTLRLATAFGVLAGLMQVIGLIRWVFVVPVLAGIATDPASSPADIAAATTGFAVLHQFAGVAIGEHLGQIFTLAWAGLVAIAQWRGAPGGRIAAPVGWLASLLILLGLVDGFATVMPIDIGPLGLATPIGFIALSAWMILTGIGLVRAPSRTD